MGKSPGKWIKTILFGKKSSKHNVSKKGEKVLNAREVMIPATAPEADLNLGSLVASQPNTGTYVDSDRENQLESKDVPNLPHDKEVAFTDDRSVTAQAGTTEEAHYDPEKIREEIAATKAQAAFRGYLARRAFLALKGIIRLQALIRGHLVRRQAVATLCSMLGIVKLQALLRGRVVRQSEFGLEVQKICTSGKPQAKVVDPVGVNLSKQVAKLSVNNFIQKLLASSPNMMPLYVNYDPAEPNTVSMWLERWSASFFWKPRPQPKKLVKPQRKNQTLEAETRKSRRTTPRAPATNTESLTTLSSFEVEKPKRSLRKVSSGSVDPLQESPQNEIEKVKRSLRKVNNPVSNPVSDKTAQFEVEDEKPRGSLEKPSIISSVDALLERSKSSRSENMKKEAVSGSHDLLDAENTPEPIERNNELDLCLGNKPTEETKPTAENNVKDETTLLLNGIYESHNSSNRDAKISRKNSLTAKQEVAENGMQSTPSPTLPSYMAATESAKAKLRAQGSPRFGPDGSEKSNLSRRHSLPSSTNSKGHSPSPRTQKANLSGGKGGNKSDKREVPAKAEWRR